MHTFQKLAIGFSIGALMASSALAAPNSTRHNKMLSIKQRVMINSGETRTAASLVSPTSHSSRAGLVALTNAFAGVPLPDAEVSRFQAAAIPRFNYEAFWTTMNQLQACENQLTNNAATYSPVYADGEYQWYFYQREPISTKKYANMLMGGYPSAADASTLPVQYTSDLSACNNGGNPSNYLAAAMTRENVSNYALDSPEVLDYVTSKFWILDGNRAAALKAAVVQYLQENEIEFAWVDVEFEYNHTSAAPTSRRVSTSFQIGRADTPATRGSYLGSQLVLAPDATVADASPTVRLNHIDIKYTAFTQYPDFTLNKPQNAQYLRDLLTSSNFNQNGVLSWNVTQNGASAISSAICSGVASCTGVTGEFQTTSGAYDPNFMRAGYDEDPGAPYTLDNPAPLDDTSGIKCLVKGTGSDRCRLERHNAATLMQYANAITGTLDYLGRWEVAFQTRPPKIEELGRAGVFDVCYGMEFQNSLSVNYWVRRPHWRANLTWLQGGVDYQIVDQRYEFEEIAELPDPISYTTWAQGVADNNLMGSSLGGHIRDTGIPSTPQGGQPTHYAAVNVPEVDPQTFGLPNREGALIMNPFTTRTAPNGALYNAIPNNWLVYRPIGSLTVEDTLAPNMITTSASPVYKTASVGASDALPRRWLARSGNTPYTRNADFQCIDQNEPLVDGLIAASAGIPNGTANWNTPPPDPVIPNGSTPFAGTVNAHKSGTRPNSTVAGAPGTGVGPIPDQCQVSFVPWSNVEHSIVTTGPLPDPRFVPPATCDFGGESIPGPECYAPLNFYTKHVQVTRAQDLAFYAGVVVPACNETCEVGESVKQCARPYPRFP